MTEKIAETTLGQLDYAANELLNRSKNADPPKYRLQAPASSLSKGTFSWDTQTPDGRFVEIGFIQGKQDERFRADPYNYTAEFDWFIRHYVPGTSDDSQMVRVATLRHDGVVFHVPVASGGGGSTLSTLRSPNGRYRAVMQDDGNFVVYDDIAGRPVWSWLTGKL